MSDFDTLARDHRPELHAHCYRMLGSLSDAEDVVQEALLKAWKGLASFENRASLRTWLFRITTNACIDALNKRKPRYAVQERFAKADPTKALDAPLAPSEFVDPYPGAPWGADTKERIGLAFVATLEHLPPLQRAVLLLREVIEMSAQETAALLDTSSASVESALQRARATMAAREPTSVRALEPAKLELLQRYIHAWESRDAAALTALMRDDAIMTMPPFTTWLAGKDAIGTFVGGLMAHLTEVRGRIIDIDGGKGIALWAKPPGAPAFVPSSLTAIKVEGELVASTDTYLVAKLFRFFGLPDSTS